MHGLRGSTFARRRRAALGSVAALLLLVVSGLTVPSAGSAPTSSVSSLAPSPTGPVVVAPAFVPGPGVSGLGPLPAATPLTVEVGLAPPDPVALESELALVSTPGTPEYRHYLTPAQIADRYAPSLASYSAAASYFEGAGLTVRTSPDRWSLLVSGPSSAVGAAFGTTFSEYRSGARTFYSHATPATLPAGFDWSGAIGLGNETGPRPAVTATTNGPVASPAPATCTYSAPFAPCAIDSGYNVSGLLGAGDNGSGYKLAVVDVYDAGEPQTQLAADLSSFTTTFGLPSGNVRYLYPIPTSRNLNQTYTQWGVEEALDFEWARASAPGATIEMTFAPDPTTGLYASVDWLVAHHAADVVSLSWGEPDVGAFNAYAGTCPGGCNASSDGSYTILHPVVVAAALEGMTVLAASGDCGAAMGTSGVATSYPASDPAVTGVGATDLTLGSSGAYSSEIGWSGNSSGASAPGCANQGGSGGGYAPFPHPAWQNASGFPVTQSHRGVPDVAINGGSSVIIYVASYETAVGGTSASCPMWAGFAAISDQVAGAAIGFLNPSLYATARSSVASKSFHDVTRGNNGYAAHSGWDPVTGIGSPNEGFLAHRLAAVPAAPPTVVVNLTVTPRSGPAPLVVTFHATSSGSNATVTAYDIDFGDYNATWSGNGWANWTYRNVGVFLARATVFLADGNSSVSLPTPVEVGGAGALNVTLSASTTSPAAGASVTFNANVSGGTAPYRFTFSFGDGTYAANGTVASADHAFALAGSYCANVVVWDAASPPAAGASLRLGLGVGGSLVPTCRNPTPLRASLSLPLTIAAPGDLSLTPSIAGGTPPYSVHYVASDPYVTACQCGIFRAIGLTHVWAFVNDSLLGSTTVESSLNVTAALVGWFNASGLVGTAPFDVSYTGHAAGGYNGSGAGALWSFGDGANASGASVAHTYASPGLYVARGSVVDAAGWEVSRLFVVDVLDPAAPNALAVGAVISPGPAAPFGVLTQLAASAQGGTPGYTYHWDLGDGGSAFGASAQETYGPPECSSTPCPREVWLNVSDANGTTLRVGIPFAQPTTSAHVASALTLTESAAPTSGATPLTLTGTASTAGMPLASIRWTYAPGATSTGTSGYYSYLTPGNFTLNVSATDPWGDLVVRSTAVAVVGLARVAPTISGGPSTTAGVAPLAVDFLATASGGAGGPYTYLWSFGDGAGSSNATTAHEYAAAGNYTANLTVTDASGTPARSTWSIIVYAVASVTLVVNATPSPRAAYEAYTVNITARAHCGPDAVPGCTSGNVSVTLTVLNRSGNLTTGGWQLRLPANGAGSWTLQLRAPPTDAPPAGCAAACYRIDLVVATWGSAYNGSANASVALLASTPSSGATPWLGPEGLLLVGVGVAALIGGAGVFVLVRQRRERRRAALSPSRPRSGPGAPPGA